jgi:flagellar protein FlbD
MLEVLMIKVTRLNGSELWVNAEMIEFVEATPDTVISMINLAKIVVKEPPSAIVEAVVAYRHRILHQRPQIRGDAEPIPSSPRDAGPIPAPRASASGSSASASRAVDQER